MKMRTFLVGLGLLGLLVVPVGFYAAFVPSASAQLLDDVCDQPGARDSPACRDDTGEDPITGDGGLIARLANVAAVIGGFIAVVLIMWGGFQYITSGGDSGKANRARDTIMYAVIGLLVIVLAQAVIAFILSNL